MEEQYYEDDQQQYYEEDGGNSKTLKIIMIILIVVALGLGGTLIYIWQDKGALVDALEEEKKELLAEMVVLQQDYAGLSSDYDVINSQLDSSREEVAQLIERMNEADATNRSLIRKYKQELGTLRSIMKNYIVQIDSLNASNKKYKAEAAAARKDAAESRKQNEELNRTVEGLSSKVAAGAVIKARGLELVALSKNDKPMDRSSRVEKMKVNLALVENELAEKGPVRVYVRVKDPNGVLLTNDTQRTFSVAGGEPMISTASREVDYLGQEVELSIYIKGVSEFTKGTYTVEAYTEQAKLGEANVTLR